MPIQYPYKRITAAGTYAVNSHEQFVDCAGGAITLLLNPPTVAAPYLFKAASGATVTIKRSDGKTIAGQSSIVLSAGETVQIFSDASGSFILPGTYNQSLAGGNVISVPFSADIDLDASLIPAQGTDQFSIFKAGLQYMFEFEALFHDETGLGGSVLSFIPTLTAGSAAGTISSEVTNPETGAVYGAAKLGSPAANGAWTNINIAVGDYARVLYSGSFTATSSGYFLMTWLVGSGHLTRMQVGGLKAYVV